MSGITSNPHAPSSEAAVSSDGWKMPGPNMDRLATLLAHDRELQDAMPDPQVQARIDKTATTIELVQQVCEGYAEREALKWCVNGAPTADYTECLTYGDIWKRVRAMATVLSGTGWLLKKEFVAVCGFASPGWVLVDVLALYLGAVLVPLPLNVPYEDLRSMLEESEARVVFCAAEEAHTLVMNVLAKDGACPGVEMVVVMDYGEESNGQAMVQALRPVLPATVFRVLTLGELLTDVSQGIVDSTERYGTIAAASSCGFLPPAVPGSQGWSDEANPLLGLMYTSGSTGRPKGAMYTEKLMRALWHTGFSWGKGEVPVISLGFLPLNHIVGRVTIYQALSKGGRVYFVRRSDMSTLFEDFATARPTKTMMVVSADELGGREGQGKGRREERGTGRAFFCRGSTKKRCV